MLILDARCVALHSCLTGQLQAKSGSALSNELTELAALLAESRKGCASLQTPDRKCLHPEGKAS